MRKWDSEIFQNNHIRLVKYHIGLFAFYLCIGSPAILLEGRFTTKLAFFAMFIIPSLVHLLLAYGSYKRIELSRKVSEIVFVLLIAAFPLGTLLSIFLFLPATMWKGPKATQS